MFGNGLPEMISLLIVFKVLKYLFCPPHGGEKRFLVVIVIRNYFLSGYVNGTNHVMRNAGIVQKSTKMKKFW